MKAAPLSVTLFALLLLTETCNTFPQATEHHRDAGNHLSPRDGRMKWAVVGDSWASAVAYNLSNIYDPSEREECYRSKEAWGAQIATDTTWSRDPQKFDFAACGGTLMKDLKRQMTDRTQDPELVWAMFGGNDALFGRIARACIYTPVDARHPLGWGKPWDEDSEGTGSCKLSIENAQHYLEEPELMRKEFKKALDDIFTVARERRAPYDVFNLYVSSYVRLFDDTTDDCDKWSFAHPKLSVGSPKLVKGLRKAINDKVQQVNKIQADVINDYRFSIPEDLNFHVHNHQPDRIFDGHRFCEKGRTFEDQYYHPDLWLWNLQYYDQKPEKEKEQVIEKNGVKMMSSVMKIIKVDLKGELSTLLNDDAGPGSTPRDQIPHANQYGFGWTARPFHPKFDGHTALKNAFISRMKEDRSPSVKPQPPPPIPFVCNGLTDTSGKWKYVSTNLVTAATEDFCNRAVYAGGGEQRYYPGTNEEVTIKVTGPPGFLPKIEDCKRYLIDVVINACDSTDPNNAGNYKGGGVYTAGDVVYETHPQAERQPASMEKRSGCDYTNGFWSNTKYWTWGRGFEGADYGAALHQALLGIEGCLLLIDTWNFNYGLGNDGREWTAEFSTVEGRKECVGRALKAVGAPADGCSNK